MQIDLDNYIAEFPSSNIAGLQTTGVKYENLFLPPPADSWPALASQITGASPAQHGIFYGRPCLSDRISCRPSCCVVFKHALSQPGLT